MSDYIHQTVLLQFVIKSLRVKPGGVYLDCTLGSGGHSLEILKAGGKIYGLDVDPDALSRTKKRFTKTCPNAFFRLKQANFAHLEQAATDWGLKAVDGIIMDLGLSSDQLADTARGFSFQANGPLDMRADPNLAVTAADLLQVLTKKELTELFTSLGEEKHAYLIADRIDKARKIKAITTTDQLVEIIYKVVPRKPGSHHPATQVFQALRMAVNTEIDNLVAALPQAVKLLAPKGRLAVISFHSLEDRTVKQFFKDQKQLKNITAKPITATQAEIDHNPRSRSAKLRVAEKI